MGGDRNQRGAARKVKTRGTFGGAPFVLVSDKLLDSIAYRSLGHATARVLLEMLRVYRNSSGMDTRVIEDEGFAFTHAHCQVAVAPRTFYDSLNQIERVGFFCRPPELQPIRGMMCATRWIPSQRWRSYFSEEDGQDAAARLQEREAKKADELERQSARRKAYWDASTGYLPDSRTQEGQ